MKQHQQQARGGGCMRSGQGVLQRGGEPPSLKGRNKNKEELHTPTVWLRHSSVLDEGNWRGKRKNAPLQQEESTVQTSEIRTLQIRNISFTIAREIMLFFFSLFLHFPLRTGVVEHTLKLSSSSKSKKLWTVHFRLDSQYRCPESFSSSITIRSQ